MKSIWQNLTPIHGINLGNLEIEGNFLHLIKSGRGSQDQMQSVMNESNCIQLYDTTSVEVVGNKDLRNFGK